MEEGSVNSRPYDGPALAAATVAMFPPHVQVVDDVAIQIKEIFAKNQLDDLNRFISKRATLNKFTTFLMYGSYVFQSTGIFITTLATGYSLPELTWVGIGLNMMSTLMIVFEKLNTSISTKILKDIQSIRNGTYVDEGIIVDDTKKEENKSKE